MTSASMCSEVQRMEGRLSSRDVAFDAPAGRRRRRRWQAPQYFLEDQCRRSRRRASRTASGRPTARRLHAAIADLDERSRDILARRWLTDDKATLHELAAEYGVSAERIRQLEQAAMKKIRGQLVA
jgi:RNA polymerase sigma-32 factor